MNELSPKISDIIKYLKEAGFADAANKMQKCIDMFNEDCIIDPFSSSNDIQMGRGTTSHTYGPAGPGLFSIDVGRVTAQRLVDLANRLDVVGCYSEADKLDNIIADISDMLNVIKKLDKNRKKIKKRDKKKQKEEAAVRSTGKRIDEVSSDFSGLSDSYFYSSIGNNMNT